MTKGFGYVIGIDEVGRGAVAGPIVVAGIKIKKRFCIRKQALGALKDSKKLTPQKREAWYRLLISHPDISWCVIRVTPCVIDRINIAQAANRAALRIVQKLLPSRLRLQALGDGVWKCRIYLDGGLELPDRIPHRTVIKGDERLKVIAAASIIAKVSRDRYMVRLHKKEPRFGFAIHKGYGTKLHRERIKKFGYSDWHRKTFL